MSQPGNVTADLSLMRELNRALVLQLIRRERRISRAEIAKRSSLSRSTVSSIIADLINEGLVHETGIGDSKGGRRPILLEFDYQSSYVIGVELGSSSLTTLVTDLEASVVFRRQDPFDIKAGPKAGLPHLERALREVLEHAPVRRGAISGVGIGIPGPLLFNAGTTIAPPVMPGWDGVPVRDHLTQALGLPIYVDNDANLGALAEYRWGAGQGAQHMAYIYVARDGIGCGLLADGSLYRGALGSAGEIGHVTIDESGPVCRCGNKGCLEAIAGVPALLRRAEEAGLIAHGSSIDDFLALAPRHARARALLAEVGVQLGSAIASLINLLNPDRVVVGGALTPAGELLMGPLRETVKERALAIAYQHARMLPGALGPDVVALGAAALATEGLFAPPVLERPEALGLRQPALMPSTTR